MVRGDPQAELDPQAVGVVAQGAHAAGKPFFVGVPVAGVAPLEPTGVADARLETELGRPLDRLSERRRRHVELFHAEPQPAVVEHQRAALAFQRRPQLVIDELAQPVAALVHVARVAADKRHGHLEDLARLDGGLESGVKSNADTNRSGLTRCGLQMDAPLAGKLPTHVQPVRLTHLKSSPGHERAGGVRRAAGQNLVQGRIQSLVKHATPSGGVAAFVQPPSFGPFGADEPHIEAVLVVQHDRLGALVDELLPMLHRSRPVAGTKVNLALQRRLVADKQDGQPVIVRSLIADNVFGSPLQGASSTIHLAGVHNANRAAAADPIGLTWGRLPGVGQTGDDRSGVEHLDAQQRVFGSQGVRRIVGRSGLAVFHRCCGSGAQQHNQDGRRQDKPGVLREQIPHSAELGARRKLKRHCSPLFEMLTHGRSRDSPIGPVHPRQSRLCFPVAGGATDISCNIWQIIYEIGERGELV